MPGLALGYCWEILITLQAMKTKVKKTWIFQGKPKNKKYSKNIRKYGGTPYFWNVFEYFLIFWFTLKNSSFYFYFWILLDFTFSIAMPSKTFLNTSPLKGLMRNATTFCAELRWAIALSDFEISIINFEIAQRNRSAELSAKCRRVSY